MNRDHKIRLAVSHLKGTARKLAIELLIHEPDQIKLWLGDRARRIRKHSARIYRPAFNVFELNPWQKPR